MNIPKIVEVKGLSHCSMVWILNDPLGLRMLDHNLNQVTVSKECLVLFIRNPDQFLHHFVTVNKTGSQQHTRNQTAIDTVDFSWRICAEEC